MEYQDDGDESITHVEYQTPVGMVSVRHGTTAEMRKSGASITWVKEAAIKKAEDYRVLAHIFGNLKLRPAYEKFTAWKNSVAEDGIAVGQKFKNEIIFIPEVLLSARAMKEGLRVLEPYLAFLDKESSGKIMIGTVRGDLHDIGKNLVLTMLNGVGFDAVDLGVNVKVDDFVREVAEQKPDILGVSALLTTTMPQMRDVIETLTEAGLRESIKIINGGAPVTQKY